MIRTTGNKGFQMTFENGWTVSVQFGAGNYCENRWNDVFDGSRSDTKCANAECARWYKGEDMDEPTGWVTPDDVAKFIADTANMESNA